MWRESVKLGSRELVFETGAVARQAGGAVLLEVGDTQLFAAATAANEPRTVDFLPLTTEYRLRFSAAGRIPGSYDRREGRPSEDDTLTSRLIDRSVRPLFPDGWRYETQLIVHPLSYDPDGQPGVLGIAAAAAALGISDIPWDGPVVGLWLGRVDGELVLFPTADQAKRSDLDLTVTVSRDGIVMVEGGAHELPETVVQQALELALESSRPLLELLERMARECGRPKREPATAAEPEPWLEELRERAEPLVREALAVDVKLERYQAITKVINTLYEQLAAEHPERADQRERVAAMVSALKKRLIREGVLAGHRIGGRAPGDIRAISGRSGWLRRVHGSALFTRGETQAIVTCTLGSESDARNQDTLDGRQAERFMLHYNFPPYSVGEVKPIRGPGRREIGHGNLARRALEPVLPEAAKAPWTVRVESLITESNGSSSMATVCGGTLAMLDAGLELAAPVAGIAMGLVSEGGRHVVLSDILGDEDAVGDMDFKVCGSARGITAIQLDNKLGALPSEVMAEALEQARLGRLHILERMAEIQAGPRSELSPHAPRVAALRIEPNRIGALVGPGGKTIKGLESEFGVSINISQNGDVRVFGRGADTLKQAEQRINDVAGVPRLGEVYETKVVSVQPFGSFVRLFEGIEGLLPDVQLQTGARVKVRVSGVSNRGRLVLERV